MQGSDEKEHQGSSAQENLDDREVLKKDAKYTSANHQNDTVEPSGAFKGDNFKRTTTKPSIFFKILTDEDIDERERERKEKRERILREIVSLEAARVAEEWRRLRKKKVELKERRMREVIFRELSEMWNSGQDIQHPEQVDPHIRGDSGQLSEESALRKRLFYGCFREFVNNNNSLFHNNNLLRNHVYEQKFGFRNYHKQRYQPAEQTHSNVQMSRVHHGHIHGLERRSSCSNIFNSMTWTAEELRIYYECMIKHNVWPLHYTVQHQMLTSSHQIHSQSIEEPGTSRRGFTTIPFHRTLNNVSGEVDELPEHYDRAQAWSSTFPIESSVTNTVRPVRMKKYFNPNLRRGFSSSSSSSTSMTECTRLPPLGHSHVTLSVPSSNNKMLINKNVAKAGFQEKTESRKSEEKFFVDELLKENVDHEPVCPVIGENDDVDLYDDL